jgi:hypothetical protein
MPVSLFCLATELHAILAQLSLPRHLEQIDQHEEDRHDRETQNSDYLAACISARHARGLAGLINGDVFQWGALMAGALISSLPPVLIYVVAQKWVVSGLAGGAIKG